MATIKFYTRTKSKKKLAVPLHLRLFEGKSIDEWIRLPIAVDPASWSNKTGKFKQILKEPIPDIQKEIERVEEKLEKLEKHILKALISTTRRDKEWIQIVVDQFFNPPAQEGAKTLKSYIQKYIDDATSGHKLTYRGGKRFSYATIKSVKSMQSELNKYQDELKKKIEQKSKMMYRPKYLPIDFDDVNIDFYNDWINYFNKKRYSPNTIGKHIKWLKTILKEAKENNLHNNTEFERRAFKATSSEVDTIYLDDSELKRIHELDLSNRPDLETPRDIFLIGCYVGQRFSDYSRINKITVLEDGTKVIKLDQVKTGAKVSIPVNAELYDIIKKYEVLENEIQLPPISEQHLNRQIKKVACLAKINELIEIKKTRGGLESRKEYPKYTQVTSHTARRSGLSNWYNAGIPSQYIMKLSGHKTEREFMKYLKLTSDDIAKKLSKHDYFIGNVLKVVK